MVCGVMFCGDAVRYVMWRGVHSITQPPNHPTLFFLRPSEAEAAAAAAAKETGLESIHGPDSGGGKKLTRSQKMRRAPSSERREIQEGEGWERSSVQSASIDTAEVDDQAAMERERMAVGQVGDDLMPRDDERPQQGSVRSNHSLVEPDDSKNAAAEYVEYDHQIAEEMGAKFAGQYQDYTSPLGDSPLGGSFTSRHGREDEREQEERMSDGEHRNRQRRGTGGSQERPGASPKGYQPRLTMSELQLMEKVFDGELVCINLNTGQREYTSKKIDINGQQSAGVPIEDVLRKENGLDLERLRRKNVGWTKNINKLVHPLPNGTRNYFRARLKKTNSSHLLVVIYNITDTIRHEKALANARHEAENISAKHASERRETERKSEADMAHMRAFVFHEIGNLSTGLFAIFEVLRESVENKRLPEASAVNDFEVDWGLLPHRPPALLPQTLFQRRYRTDRTAPTTPSHDPQRPTLPPPVASLLHA